MSGNDEKDYLKINFSKYCQLFFFLNNYGKWKLGWLMFSIGVSSWSKWGGVKRTMVKKLSIDIIWFVYEGKCKFSCKKKKLCK